MAIKNFWIEAEIDGRKTKWKGGPARPNKVEEVSLAREKMEALGVLEAAKTSVIFHSDQALQLVKELPGGESRETFEFFIREMQRRLH